MQACTSAGWLTATDKNQVPASLLKDGVKLSDPEILEHVTQRFDCALESLQAR